MSPVDVFDRWRRDLWSIGPWAPIRVGYELARRVGVHRLAFTALATRPAPVRLVHRVMTLPPVDRLSAEVRARTLADAAEIAAGHITLFSQPFDLGTEPDWHAVLSSPGRWPDQPWWTIDLRAADRPGDVKWIWEMGRQRHLVVLARAAELEPDEPRWLATLARQLESFIDANPAEIGVHWCSSLELALRTFAWLEVVARVGDRLPTTVSVSMAGHLWHAGRHILAELPYSRSSMQNNHLLGEAAGLIALGRALDLPRWETIGRRLYDSQLVREIMPDGSTVEESLSYQRFVMELVTQRVLAGGNEIELRASREALRHGAGFLTRLGVLEGPVPQYGDWDEGRALATSGDAMDLSGTVHLARALTSGARQPQNTTCDEVAWYAPVDVTPAPTPLPRLSSGAVTDGRALGGGMARAASGELVVWLRAGATRWHAHADLASISVRLGDEWVIGDPGTGSYNGDDEERRWFRSSRAHGVLLLDDREQVQPHRAFRWLADPWSSIGAPLHEGDTTVLWAAHAAYPQAVARAVLVRPGEVTILDSVAPASGASGAAAAQVVLHFPLGPATSVRDDRIRLPSGRKLRLFTPPGVDRDTGPGRWSPTYGQVEPTSRLSIRATAPGPWVCSLTEGDDPEWRHAAGGVQRDQTRVTLDWRGSVIELHLASPGVFQRRVLRLRPAE